jgi:hypothetical protein
MRMCNFCRWHFLRSVFAFRREFREQVRQFCVFSLKAHQLKLHLAFMRQAGKFVQQGLLHIAWQIPNSMDVMSSERGLYVRPEFLCGIQFLQQRRALSFQFNDLFL